MMSSGSRRKRDAIRKEAERVLTEEKRVTQQAKVTTAFTRAALSKKLLNVKAREQRLIELTLEGSTAGAVRLEKYLREQLLERELEETRAAIAEMHVALRVAARVEDIMRERRSISATESEDFSEPAFAAAAPLEEAKRATGPNSSSYTLEKHIARHSRRSQSAERWAPLFSGLPAVTVGPLSPPDAARRYTGLLGSLRGLPHDRIKSARSLPQRTLNERSPWDEVYEYY